MNTSNEAPLSGPLHERLEATRTSLSKGELRVAEFMSMNSARVALCSAKKLGELTLTSDATAIRTIRKLGYRDIYELRESIVRTRDRLHNPSQVLGDQLTKAAHDGPIYQQVLNDTISLLHMLRSTINPDEWDKAVELLIAGSTVHTYGIGTSRVIGDYLSLALRRNGIRTHAIGATGMSLSDELLPIERHDTLVVFPTLRRFREIDVALAHAERCGARTLVITETLGASLRNKVDVILTTPQSTTTTSNGVTIGLTLARALEMDVAARNNPKAVASLNTMSELRAEIVGRNIDLA